MENKDHYNRILDRTRQRNIPFKVFWELTYGCNLNCRHCYIHPQPEREELNQEEIKRALTQIYDRGALFITFSGGEALTRNDFFEIAGHARGLGLAIRIFTNGTMVNAEIADRIKELNPLSVEISLYAMCATIHDAITRQRGSFAKTVSAIKMLKAKDLEVVIKFPLMETNFAEFERIKEFANRLNSRFVFDLNIIPKEDGDRSPLALRLSEGHLREFFCEVDAAKYWAKREVGDEEPVCDAGLNSLSVSPYGDVFPCVGARLKMGNLRENNINEIWDSGGFERFRLLNTFSNLGECRECDLLSFCRRCPGVARLEDGDLQGKSGAACRVTKLQYSLLKGGIAVG